jgi:hypothetical protein
MLNPMSALGQEQTCAAHKPMFALPPKADMCTAKRMSAKCHKRTLVRLFDHII